MIEDFEKFYNHFSTKIDRRITGSSTDEDILEFIEQIRKEYKVIDEEYVHDILFELRNLLRKGYDEEYAWDYIIGEEYIWRE